MKRTVVLSARLALVSLGAWLGASLHSPLGPLIDVIIGALLGLALVGLGHGIFALAAFTTGGLARRIGAGSVAVLAGMAALLLGFAGLPWALAAVVTAVWLLAAGGVGAAIAAIRARGGSLPARVAVATAGLAVSALTMAWWFWPAGGDPLRSLGLATPSLPVTAPASPDPVAERLQRPGPHETATVPYGAGAADDSVAAATFDASEQVALAAPLRAVRSWLLGHDLSEVPVRGIVTYPIGAGPGRVPLVLIAHGNANLFRRSHAGYQELAERLASHGMVVASIDASSFGALPIVGGLRGENDARALQVLSHLQAWTDGTYAPGRSGLPVDLPRVDADRIALVGHSRGGEAVALAALYDRIGALPERADALLAERFGGPYLPRAVVAIAPSDQQLRPGDRPAQLQELDYLVIHAGMDADVAAAYGDRQFERTRVAAGGLRASVFLHRATHAGFNAVWGPSDLSPPLSRLVTRDAAMDPQEQRRATATIIGTFLVRSLYGETAGDAIFRDPATLAAHLPPTAVLVRFADGHERVLADFSEDVDPRTATLGGARISAQGLTEWREGDPVMRGGVRREANAVTLAWAAEPDGPEDSEASAVVPSWSVTREVLPLPRLTPAGSVRLDLAAGTESVRARDGQASEPLDLFAELIDDAGRVATVRLSEVAAEVRAVPTRFGRVSFATPPWLQPETYPLFATVQLPVARFLESEPELDLGRLRTLRLRLEAQPEGSLVLRSVAFVP